MDLSSQDHGYTSSGYTADYLKVLLEQDDFALIDDTLGVIFYPEYRDCRVIRIPETYLFSPIAFGLPKDSPFKEIIDYEIAKLKEKGVYQRYIERYTRPSFVLFKYILCHPPTNAIYSENC